MRSLRFMGIVLVCWLIGLGAPANAANPDVGRQPASVTRLTSDGQIKEGAVISADGSTVAWFQAREGSAWQLMAAPADGSAAPRTLLATDPRTGRVENLRGPAYAEDDLLYQITLGSQHIQLSADGGTLAIEAVEQTRSGRFWGWIVINTGSGAAKYVAEAYPAGLGFRAAGPTVYGGAQSAGSGYYALSGDGRTLLFMADGYAENGSRPLLVALDIASGQARRIAGYTSLTAKAVGEADPKGVYFGPWVSPTGTLVAFRAFAETGAGLYVGGFGTAAPAPALVATLSIGSVPQFTAGGEYLAARHPTTTASTFWPMTGGAGPIELAHRDVFAIPFVDGTPGVVEVPVWTSQEQEVRVVRPHGAAVMLRPGEKGLPAGWSFGVTGVASGSHWTLADAYGKRVLLPLVSPDGKRQDLFVLTLSVTVAKTKVVLKIDSPAAKVGDKVMTLDVPPFVQNGRTLVPLRFIGEQLGASIAWDQAEQRVTYTRGATIIQLWIGRAEALVDGKAFPLDVPPQIVNGRTVVPARFVAQALGATIEWNGETSEVTITAP